MRALILEHGLNRGALAGARSLGRAGWQVGIGVSSRGGLARLSRHARRTHTVPAPGEGTDAFLHALREAVAEGGYEVVFPVDDEQVLALSAHRAEIPSVVPYAEHAVVERALDRMEQIRLAERHGLAAPHTSEATPAAIARWGDRMVAVKARSPQLLGSGRERQRVETLVGPASQATARAEEIRAAGGTPIVQEVVEGTLMSFSALADRDGRIVAEEQQVAERIWPSDAGVSARATTVPVDRALAEGVAGMLGELRWFGLAQLQFLVPPGAPPKLIDFNPRFYGSLGLAVRSGVDLPARWAAMASDRDAGPAVTARAGVRYHWLGADIRRALREPEHGRLRDLGASLRWTRGTVHGVWSMTDPAPAVRTALGTVGARLRP